MIGQLLNNLLQVAQGGSSPGESANIFESDGTTKVKFYHWQIWQLNGGNAAVYHLLNSTPNRDKTGISKADDIQVQITVWHEDEFEANTIAENIRTVLEGWSGTYESKVYYKTLFDNQVETFEPELQLPGVVQTYTFSVAK